MKNGFDSRWTPKAATWLNNQMDYWENNGMERSAKNFSKDLVKKLDLIVVQPEVGRATSNFKKIRFVTIDKRYRLFYRIKPTDINILTFFDTKQDLNKSPY